MEPDGRLVVYYSLAAGPITNQATKAFPFKDIRGWKAKDYGIVIYMKDGKDAYIIPWTAIMHVKVTFNSEEYVLETGAQRDPWEDFE